MSHSSGRSFLAGTLVPLIALRTSAHAPSSVTTRFHLRVAAGIWAGVPNPDELGVHRHRPELVAPFPYTIRSDRFLPIATEPQLPTLTRPTTWLQKRASQHLRLTTKRRIHLLRKVFHGERPVNTQTSSHTL